MRGKTTADKIRAFMTRLGAAARGAGTVNFTGGESAAKFARYPAIDAEGFCVRIDAVVKGTKE